METLKFTPQVFRIETASQNGTSVWDLLTVDGETPDSTFYFMLYGDSPSFNDSDKINEAIENREWDKYSVEDLDLTLDDFSIDYSVFDTAGEGYAEIKKVIKSRFTASGERVSLTGDWRDLGHGCQLEVVYSDSSTGWEHKKDLTL